MKLFSTSMRKNLGDKGKYITEEQIQELFETYQNNEEMSLQDLPKQFLWIPLLLNNLNRRR